jgi:hypothetical protein
VPCHEKTAAVDAMPSPCVVSLPENGAAEAAPFLFRDPHSDLAPDHTRVIPPSKSPKIRITR